MKIINKVWNVPGYTWREIGIRFNDRYSLAFYWADGPRMYIFWNGEGWTAGPFFFYRFH